ncbi:MAG: amino acid permease, partial [Acidobacteriota bacterium]
SGVMTGVAAVFFAYIGFDALSTTAEECENPRRDLPRAMIYSLAICTVLYILLALVLTGMEPFSNLNVGDPLAFVFRDKLPWLAGVIAVSAVIALATVFLVFQIGQPRLWMAMSRDGLLPRIFSSIHPRFKTPWFSTILTGIVVAIPALFMNLTEVTDLGVIGTLFAFTLVCGGILIKDEEFGREDRYVPYVSSRYVAPAMLLIAVGLLYYFNPGFLRDFMIVKPEEGETWFDAFSHKIPYIVFAVFSLIMVVLAIVKRFSLIPFLGVMSCTYLMTELGIINWMRFGIWLLVGLRIYRSYGFTKSLLNVDNRKPGLALRAGSVVADVALFSLVLIPYVLWPLIGYILNIETPLSGWFVFLCALVIGLGLEAVTTIWERRDRPA